MRKTVNWISEQTGQLVSGVADGEAASNSVYQICVLKKEKTDLDRRSKHSAIKYSVSSLNGADHQCK